MRENISRASRRRSTRQAVLALAVGALPIPSLFAAQYTFTATGANVDWLTPGAWSPTGPPGSSDDAIIVQSTSQTMTLNAANLTIQAITFTPTNATGAGTARTLTNNGVSDSTLTLNTLPDGTLINVGNLSTGTANFTMADGATNKLNLVLAASGTINTAGTSTVSIGSTITESGVPRSITKTGGGTLQMKGSQGYTGGIFLNAGTLNFNGAAASFGSNALEFTGSSTVSWSANSTAAPSSVIIDSTVNATFATLTATIDPIGSLSGSGNLTKLNGGTLTFTGNNSSFSGNFTITGVLQVGNGGSTGGLGSGSVSLGNSSTSYTTLIFNRSGAYSVPNYLTTTSVTNGIGRVVVKGGGSIEFASLTNAYLGATQIDSGTLQIGSIASGGAVSPIGKSPSAGGLNFNGGALRYVGSGNTSTRSFIVTKNGGTIDASGSGALNFNATLGTGSATFDAPAHVVTLGATTTIPMQGGYSVDDLQAGMLVGGTGYATPSIIQSVDTVNNTITVAAAPSTTGNGTLTFTGGGSRTLTFTGTSLPAVNNNINLRLQDPTAVADPTLLPGGVNGVTNVTKSGSNTWILAASNTYSGTTTVSDGILRLGAGGAFVNTPLFNMNGGTLDVSTQSAFSFTASQAVKGLGNITGGTTSTTFNASLQIGATDNVNAGGGGVASTLNVAGGTTILGASSTTKVDLYTAATLGQSDLLSVSGLTYGGTLVVSNVSGSPLAVGMSWNLFDFTSQSGSIAIPTPSDPSLAYSFDPTSGVLSVVAAPEPTSFAVVSMAACAMLRRRRRKVACPA